MRPMEHRPHAGQRDANPASGALADLGPGSAQQRLDIMPAQFGGGRLRKDPPECAPVAAVHVTMTS